MNKKPSLFTASLKKTFQHDIANLWPAFKGSLAQVRKPCIRPHCSLCSSGLKHKAFIFSFTDNGKRRCLYVPNELVSFFKLALKNGRHLEQILYKSAPLFLHNYRKSRSHQSLPKESK